MNDGMSTFSIFIICLCCLLAFCAFLGGVSYWVHEANLPNQEKIAKINACAREERVDVRALCIAVSK